MDTFAKPAGAGFSEVAADSALRTLYRVGWWAAVLTVVFYIGWLIGLIVNFLAPAPWGEYAMMAPSVFIPLAWVPLMLVVRRWAPRERQIFGDISVAFAVMYGSLLTMNYFVALTVTIPKGSQGPDVGILAIQPQSFFLAVEAVGYTLMSLSALFASFVFKGGGLKGWIRWMLLITGIFGLALPLQMLWASWPSPPDLLIAPRELALPTAAILLAVMFSRRVPGSAPDDLAGGRTRPAG